MREPISFRKGIPFFCSKSEVEFRQDVYERYDEMVVRQSALHMADEIWGGYPMQKVLDFAKSYYPKTPIQNILEVGCGVGRWIAEAAHEFPDANCWGIDYSYQMLKQANDVWVNGKELILDLSNRGFSKEVKIEGHNIGNLQFGLAKATDLPFEDESQDLILNSFLLDRVDDPILSLKEWYRVLKSNGRLIIVTPLNFQQASHWDNLYPPNKIKSILTNIGFEILAWQEDLKIDELLDLHGNNVRWKCLGLVLWKT